MGLPGNPGPEGAPEEPDIRGMILQFCPILLQRSRDPSGKPIWGSIFRKLLPWRSRGTSSPAPRGTPPRLRPRMRAALAILRTPDLLKTCSKRLPNLLQEAPLPGYVPANPCTPAPVYGIYIYIYIYIYMCRSLESLAFCIACSTIHEQTSIMQY